MIIYKRSVHRFGYIISLCSYYRMIFLLISLKVFLVHYGKYGRNDEVV